MLKIGSHVSISGPNMFLSSVQEALSYDANTFMVYTGAPQNTVRKPIEKLRIPEAQALMKEAGIKEFIVHAPYIINLGNSLKPETFSVSVDVLKEELSRTEAMGGRVLVLHPGAHVGAGAETGTEKIIEGLNEVLTRDAKVLIALETMAGKGSEIGRSFEELARIINGVTYPDKLRVCFDTCHVHDAGYDIVDHFNEVMVEFDQIIGKEKIAVFHINDSMNERGAKKDRHANIGKGYIGLEALKRIVHAKDFLSIPKILETPYIPAVIDGEMTKLPPYKEEIAMLK